MLPSECTFQAMPVASAVLEQETSTQDLPPNQSRAYEDAEGAGPPPAQEEHVPISQATWPVQSAI